MKNIANDYKYIERIKKIKEELFKNENYKGEKNS